MVTLMTVGVFQVLWLCHSLEIVYCSSSQKVSDIICSSDTIAAKSPFKYYLDMHDCNIIRLCLFLLEIATGLEGYKILCREWVKIANTKT